MLISAGQQGVAASESSQQTLWLREALRKPRTSLVSTYPRGSRLASTLAPKPWPVVPPSLQPVPHGCPSPKATPQPMQVICPVPCFVQQLTPVSCSDSQSQAGPRVSPLGTNLQGCSRWPCRGPGLPEATSYPGQGPAGISLHTHLQALSWPLLTHQPGKPDSSL